MSINFQLQKPVACKGADAVRCNLNMSALCQRHYEMINGCTECDMRDLLHPALDSPA